MTSIEEIRIRPFERGDEAIFRKLNEEWITRYFVLEEADLASFADPQTKILDRGGKILFAEKDGEVVGCCALAPMGSGAFEVAKMAVTASCRGAGIGRQLLEQTIATARGLGARRLYLETNQKLAVAIRLYESVGFRHLPTERVAKSPYARADVYMELFL
jgi:GNAT superfamily N-acetyltransferase